VEEVRSAGGVAQFVACDISSEPEVEELIVQSVSFLGGLDFAVNNAGFADHPGFLHELPVDTWDKVLSVDLRGTFLCMRAELRVMHAAVCPGTIRTPGIASFPEENQKVWADMMPMGRMGTPEEVAPASASCCPTRPGS
jgi:NAD(P)-dependent dehydrogenase (short-subunit alcohol dehydrogenase family)